MKHLRSTSVGDPRRWRGLEDQTAVAMVESEMDRVDDLVLSLNAVTKRRIKDARVRMVG